MGGPSISSNKVVQWLEVGRCGADGDAKAWAGSWVLYETGSDARERRPSISDQCNNRKREAMATVLQKNGRDHGYSMKQEVMQESGGTFVVEVVQKLVHQKAGIIDQKRSVSAGGRVGTVCNWK
jgi:hypothetical protein